MSNIKTYVPLLAALLATPLIAAFAAKQIEPEVLVNERFSDRNRNGQNPPESLQWFASVSGGVNVRGTLLHLFARRDGTREVVAHFPAVTLAPGEELILEFDFDYGIEPTANPYGFAFGLFDSAEKKQNRFSADDTPTSSTSEGYSVSIDAGSEAQPASFAIASRKRNSGSLLPLNTDPRERIAETTLLPDRLYRNRSYHAELRIQALPEGKAQLSFELSGGGIPSARLYRFQTQGDTPLTFDTLAMRITRPGVSDLYLGNISLIKEPALPLP